MKRISLYSIFTALTLTIWGFSKEAPPPQQTPLQINQPQINYRQFTGKHPGEILSDVNLKERFIKLLGEKFIQFNMGLEAASEAEIIDDKYLYAEGIARSSGGFDESAFAIDIYSGNIYASMLTNGDRVDYFGASESSKLPRPLAEWHKNHSESIINSKPNFETHSNQTSNTRNASKIESDNTNKMLDEVYTTALCAGFFFEEGYTESNSGCIKAQKMSPNIKNMDFLIAARQCQSFLSNASLYAWKNEINKNPDLEVIQQMTSIIDREWKKGRAAFEHTNSVVAENCQSWMANLSEKINASRK